MTCFTTYLASIGGCRHLYYLTPEQALKAVKWSWISEPWGVFLFATGKAAVAILTLRIMGKPASGASGSCTLWCCLFLLPARSAASLSLRSAILPGRYGRLVLQLIAGIRVFKKTSITFCPVLRTFRHETMNADER